jgi:quinol monooxygenase YgiN
MIIITAVMKAKEGNGDDLAKVIKEFVPKFEKDPGLLMYKAHRRADNPNMVFFYEQYENNEALTFHSSAPHFKEMGRAMKPFLDGRADIAMYQEI